MWGYSSLHLVLDDSLSFSSSSHSGSDISLKSSPPSSLSVVDISMAFKGNEMLRLSLQAEFEILGHCQSSEFIELSIADKAIILSKIPYNNPADQILSLELPYTTY